MNTQTNLRAQALKLASQLVKQTTLSFGAAQKQAWASVKLWVTMQQQPVRFFYLKQDGSQREAIGFYGAVSPLTEPESLPQIGLAIRYYDTRVQNWRTFRADRLIIN